ncbi:MAG: L-rhamnose isomerase [Christensenellales bacterium]|jgi:L-rhamnose isomerase
MRFEDRYASAKEMYASIGVDTDAALEELAAMPISMHCWQGDDCRGFDSDRPLSGGIAATGNYPGRASTPDELMADMDMALRLIPGRHKINLHASYAIFEPGEWADRDELEPKHFKKWVDYAKARGLGIDFNPTYFSHPMAESFTLASPDKCIRDFWTRHTKRCIRICEYFASEVGQPCAMNIWIPDGLKDVPADRLGPRARFKASLDDALSIDYDREKVYVCLESKLFGIGLESYTVGSGEFALLYAAKNNLLPLMDNGHYHPTESVADKIPTLLLFNEKIALHVTRSVRWDSDHVVLNDDVTRDIALEIVRCDAMDRVFLALDFFDASINRVSAWVVGMRNMQKALLYALLMPHDHLWALQDAGDYSTLMVLQEELKMYPLGDVWSHFCEINGVEPLESWFETVRRYEQDVQLKRK